MEKTAGAILAELLIARDNGASKKVLERKTQQFLEQSKKQLSGPGTKVTVAVKTKD